MSNPRSRSSRGGRDAVIDILRGSAILLMIVWHAVMWFSQTQCHVQTCTPGLEFVWRSAYDTGSLFSVPLFYFAAGMTLALSLEKGAARRVIRRSLLIILMGYTFTGFIMGWERSLHVWVLQSIGVGLLLMLALSQLRFGWLLLYAGSLGATLWNVGKLEIAIPDYSASAGVRDYLAQGLSALFLDGSFAALPWSGFIALGFASRSDLLKHSGWAVGIAILLGLFGTFLTVSKYPLSTGYLLLFSSLCLLGQSALARFQPALQGWLRETRSGGTLALLSRHSLGLFLVHYAVGHELATRFPTWKMPIGWAIVLGTGFIGLSAAVLASWQHKPGVWPQRSPCPY